MLVYGGLHMAGSASKEGFGGEGTRFENDASEPGQPEPGRQLGPGDVLRGKYRIERLIGEGGMGSVWQALHLQLDLPVALKLLRAERDKALLTERMKLEARASARLVHPAIVRVFDIDATDSGEPFIVMELLDGESLAELLDRGRLSGVSAVQTLLPIAEALSLAHAKGIIHRDIKPHNVFLAKDGERLQPKLLDFGIAKLTGAAQRPGNLTDTGVAVGSPDYMSPEQARGQSDLDYRADIWQFSVVLYEAVAGRTPYDGDNYNALMRAIVEDEPSPL
jgi:eukaryotic-like serine/threonine-protein kinase